MKRRQRSGAGRPGNVGELLDRAARRLQRARLHYGHGTGNARDDAAALVFHSLGLDHSSAPASYARPVSARAVVRAEKLTPNTPPSAQLGTVPGSGGSGNRQR